MTRCASLIAFTNHQQRVVFSSDLIKRTVLPLLFSNASEIYRRSISSTDAPVIVDCQGDVRTEERFIFHGTDPSSAGATIRLEIVRCHYMLSYSKFIEFHLMCAKKKLQRTYYAEFFPQTTLRRLCNRFARAGMRAAGVGPKAAGMILAGSPTLQQHSAFRIGDADRNCAMSVATPMHDKLFMLAPHEIESPILT